MRSLVYAATQDADTHGKIVAVFIELEPHEWPDKLAAIVGSPS